MTRTPARTPARTAVLSAVLSAVLTAGLVGGAPPAAADPMTLALLAASEVWVDTTTATSATVCARGWVDDGAPTYGQWLFRVVGTTVTATASSHGPTFAKDCVTIRTLGQPAGYAEATLAYVGVGGDTLAHCSLVTDWAPTWPIGGAVGACTGAPPMP